MRMKRLLTFLTLLTVFIGVGWAETVTLSWAGNEGASDGSELTASSVLSASANYDGDATTYVTCQSASKVYIARGTNGLKFGSNSNIGSLTFAFSSTIKPSKIIVRALKYGSDTGNIQIKANNNDNLVSTGAPGSDDFAEIELSMDGNTSLSNLKVATTSKRAFVKSITITYDDSGSQSTVGSPIISFDIFTAGKTTSTVTIEPGENATTTYYKIGTDGTWQTYSEPLEFNLKTQATPITVYA